VEQQLVEFLGRVVAYGGGGAAVAFLMFKKFGEGWLDAKFKEKLKAAEHQYAVELQRLKQRLDTASSGIVRLHQKEFEVLPEAYGLLDEAMGMLAWITSPLQQYADVASMGDDDLQEFIDGTEFSKFDKAELRNADRRERQKLYIKCYDRARSFKVEKSIRDFQNYAARHSIFLPEDLRQQFDEIRGVLWGAAVAKSVGMQADDWKTQLRGWTDLEEKAKPQFEAIRNAIQGRLQRQAELDLSGLTDFR